MKQISNADEKEFKLTMSEQFAFNYGAESFSTLFGFQNALRKIINEPSPVGLKEVCANILWQIDNCDPVDQYNIDLEIMQTLSESQIALFLALCETANQLKINEKKKTPSQKAS